MITREEFYDLSGVEDPRVLFTNTSRISVSLEWIANNNLFLVNSSDESRPTFPIRDGCQHSHGSHHFKALQGDVRPHEKFQSNGNKSRNWGRQAWVSRVQYDFTFWKNWFDLFHFLIWFYDFTFWKKPEANVSTALFQVKLVVVRLFCWVEATTSVRKLHYEAWLTKLVPS